MLKNQVEIQLRHYDKLERLNNEMQSFRHDYVNHLRSLQLLIQMNDNNGASDQHLPPLMAGDSLHVNWKEVMAALDEIEYKGVYNFEFALNRLGRSQEEAVTFLGKFLRRFVNGSL